jgi:hypothetical protein
MWGEFTEKNDGAEWKMCGGWKGCGAHRVSGGNIFLIYKLLA